jgi:uncharacterized protein YrrD
MVMMEQGSYMLIQRGMIVRGTDGDVGTVAQVVADAGVDVFRGLVISHGLLLPHQGFLSADHVVSVIDNVVQVDISKSDAGKLPSAAEASAM